MEDTKNMFAEEVQEILTEDSLSAIEEAVTAKVNDALEKQDEVYAEKLEVLIDTLDKDRAEKMKRVIESVDKNNADKLIKVINKFKRESLKEAGEFRKMVVESVNGFLDEYIDMAIPKEDFTQAVKNRNAYTVLENLRGALAVDSVMMKESVRDAMEDGHQQISKLEKENMELKKNFKALYEANEKTKVDMLIENKTSKFPDAKKNFIRKTLADKPLKFIEENFDYTLRLFDKQETQKLKVLKEDAIAQRENKPDFAPIQKVATEKLNTYDPMDEFVSAMAPIH
jgi:hypothetical protein